MDVLSFDLKKDNEDSLTLRNSMFSMDYDSGYISNNLESNLDTYMDDNRHSVNTVNNRPIYLSEDALLETPEVNKYSNISLEIEREDFEETRHIFSSPPSSASTTEVPASVGSREMSYSGFDTEESNSSIKIPYCKQIIVSEYNSPDICMVKRDIYREQHLKNFVFNNITNTLTFNDAKKKLTLIFSKDDKENVYSVKRKYPSLTPEKSFNSDNSFCFPTPKKFKKVSNSETSKESESIIDNSLCVSSESGLKGSENADVSHNGDEENLNCEKGDISIRNITMSTLGEQSDLEVSNNENIECYDKFLESGDKNSVRFDVSEVINIKMTKENVSVNISKIAQDNEHIQNICVENQSNDNNLLKSFDDDSTNSEVFRGFENDRLLDSNKMETIEALRRNSEELQQNIDLNNFAITSTPEKPLKNPNSANLSPDLFTDDVEENIPVIVPIVSFTPKEKNIDKKDYMILRRTQNNLKGVIPPRSLTTINISVTEMLKKIDNNKGYFWKSCTNVQSSRNESKSMLITCPLENCKNKAFPDVLKDRSLGLYYNRSKLSEEFEELCGKYGQRYVGMETQSSCTVFETNTASPTKRRNVKPQWNLKSPGKRLSHLARRRITFSSANLQLGSSFSAGSRARQILVDAKKMDLLSRRRSPRKTPKKTPGKSPRKKTRTPSSSAKKKLAMRFRKVTGEIEKSDSSLTLSAKRTLFHSPEENKKSGRLLPSTSGTLSTNELKTSATKRALFMSPSKSSPLKSMGFKRTPVKRLDFGMEEKRKRADDSQDEPLSKFPRCQSAPSSSEIDTRSLNSRTKSDFSLSQNRQTKELTTNNKKKLQLAVYEALRSQNVLPTHPKFKIFASNLGRLTKKLFLPTSADCVGVTEKMLRIARHHVIPVVKGKSVEEIYEEYMKNKAKNVKPQGYIAPYEEMKPIAIKTCDSKVDRIRKAINFGDT
ncbi:uncharacterized protein LOC130894811 [Diorhabda carinulata]|uniref:uncharacterized protein LOC130894811 n=1 Tax=Diorhabda carinulata TaxID=1163345 RepID=UPI0025A284FB|nr:uncharacterized protein LOC130894811 [Diorhabda carinulata]